MLNRGRKIADGTLEELRALAGLPSRLHCVIDGTPRQIELGQDEKPAVLRALVDQGATRITLEDPSLDDIYAHFLQREAA